MTNKDVKVIILDLDGTIVDTFLFHYYTMKEAMKSFGIDLKIETFRKLFGIDGGGILKRLGVEPNKENIKKLIKEKIKLSRKYIDKIKLIDNIKRFLDEAKGKFKLAVLSNSWRKDIEFILNSVDLLEYFDLIVGADDAKPKPNPDGIFKIMEHFGAKKEEVLYIGDHEIDEEVAKKAGVKFLMIGRDFRDYDELLKILFQTS